MLLRLLFIIGLSWGACAAQAATVVSAPDVSGGWQGEWATQDGALSVHDCAHNICKFEVNAGNAHGVCEAYGDLILHSNAAASFDDDEGTAAGACHLDFTIASGKIAIVNENAACSALCGANGYWSTGYKKISEKRFYLTGFACVEARKAIELAICTDEKLAKLDRDLSVAYGERMAAYDARKWTARKKALVEKQRKWIVARNAECGDSANIKKCVTPLYEARLQELTKIKAGDEP